MFDASVVVIDRRDPVPLHHQVRRALLGQIRGEALRPGDQLPTEAELCARFNVSRQTLRQAVDGLVQEHVLYRERPRGTFVGFGAVEGDLHVLRSVWEDLRRQGMEPEVRLLEAAVVPAGEIAPYLEVSATAPALRLRRVFSADGTPVSYDVTYFPLPEFAWLQEEDLTSSWYVLLRSRGIAVEYARTTIAAEVATPGMADHLRVEPGVALLQLRRQTYAQSDRLLAYSTAWYRSDRYTFAVTLSRRGTEAPEA